MHEYRLRLDGYEKKERAEWERTRWHAFMCYLESPYIKQKAKTPHAFAPFPWDDEEAKKRLSPTAGKVTAEQRAHLDRMLLDFKERNNG